jgi:CheY-like chemotaxis protein
VTNHRIRVLVAGDVYANRELVRPFLEDDGYEIAGEAFERADLMPEVIRQQPDAVVIDEAILAGRRKGKTLQRIRRAAPDAKLVVLTTTPDAAAFADADATLEAGLSLAALTSLLGRIFAEDEASPPVVGVGGTPGGVGGTAGAAAAAGAGAASGVGAAPSRAAPTAGVPEPRGSLARIVASIGLPLVIVWSLIALLTTGGGTVLPRADTTDLAAGGVVVIPTTDGPLKGAQDSLDHLLRAIKAGDPVLATMHAQALMEARASAKSLGYPVEGLDSEVESALSAVVGLLSPGATGALSTILGDLFPQIGGEPDNTPGGGSGLILGSAAAPSAATVITGSLGGGGGGTSADDDGEGDGEGDGGRHRGDEGEGGGGFVALGPGDGREWGQSHKPSKGTGGGPPPWAHASGGGTDGSDDAPDHPGHAYGHDEHPGNGKHEDH